MKTLDLNNPYIKVETITSYKAVDGRIFDSRDLAVKHNKNIINTQMFEFAVSDIKELLKEKIHEYNNIYEISPETDFW